MRGSNFSYLMKQGLIAVWQNRLMSFASFCILMVSLLLVGLAVLFSLNIGIIIGNLEDNNEIVVFVYSDTPEAELSQISATLKGFDYVDKVIFVSKEEAWEIQKQSNPVQYHALYDAAGGENLMPSTFRVSLNDITMMKAAAERFKNINYVEKINAPDDTASFLISIRTTFTIIGIAILFALIVVCLVIIYNTARASVFARRMQISIMKHVGATNAFIRFPFFIEGMFIGIIAGAASWFLTKTAYESVVALFAGDIQILEFFGLHNVIGFNEVTWYVLAGSCLAGALLGAVGTIFSMGKHLKV